MRDQSSPQPEVAEEKPHSPAGSTSIPGISRARKVRLGVLICVLAALGAVLAYVRKKEQQHREAVVAALADLREVVRQLDPALPPPTLSSKFALAESLYQQIRKLDPDNVEVDKLAVPLCYANGSFDRMLELFNGLDAKLIAKDEIDKMSYRKAVQALEPFPTLYADAFESEIHGEGRDYLRRCGFVWGLARAITAGAATDKDKALLLCLWMALHVLPEQHSNLPADPYMAAWRGYGSPAELAWAYAELSRQAGLRAKVAVLPATGQEGDKEYLVQVYPSGGQPFLVSPLLGIPVIEPASGELLSLDSLAGRPEAYAALLELAGARSEYGTDHFKAAELKTAADPRVCFPRFLVFDYLLSPLPARPQVSFDFGSLAAEERLDLWEVPIQILDQMRTRGYAEQAGKAYAALEMVEGARAIQLQGHNKAAVSAYEALSAELKKKVAEAEIPEAAAVLEEAVEHASFLGATSVYDGGDRQQAEEQLRAHIAHYNSGRWRTLAAALLAEAANEDGDKAAATAMWKDLPEARRLYGVLRMRGLLAWPSRAAQAARGTGEAGATGGPLGEGPAADAGPP